MIDDIVPLRRKCAHVCSCGHPIIAKLRIPTMARTYSDLMPRSVPI
ncbi:MAG: hypothetical protein Q8R44_09160 [Novosphingobium sp.]|nr:hypothetical protein [Novosphingobium sp.]